MSKTDSERAEFGQKAFLQETKEAPDSTKIQADGLDSEIKIICKDACSGTETFYIKINFDTQKKKNAYKKINRILGEG